MGSQMSPPPSDQGTRVNTPQNNLGGYMTGLPYGQGFNQNYGSPGLNPNGMQASLQTPPNSQNQSLHQQQINAQRAYYRMQQAQLSGAQGRPMTTGMNPMVNSMGQAQNTQMTRQMPPTMMKSDNSESFLKQVKSYMTQNGWPFDQNPVIAGRPISLANIWSIVIRNGGYENMPMDSWSKITHALQISPIQYPNAAQELQNIYHRNLSRFEAYYNQRVKEQRARQNNDPTVPQNQASPVKQPNQQARAHSPLQQLPHSQIDAANAMKPMHSMPNNVHTASMNGFATPPGNRQGNKNVFNQPRSGLSRPPEVTPPHGPQAPFPSPSPAPPGKRVSSATEKSLQGPDPLLTQIPPKLPIEDPFKPAVLPESRFHGPIIVDEISQLTAEMERFKPTVPSLMELGVIDIHALNMSIKSGIHAEVRLALDTLTTISVDQNAHLQLNDCDDLVESLVDCARDQSDLLAEYAAEVSDVMLISSYEDVLRGCRAEIESIQDAPAMGTVDYDLDRSVDRLICITTILRNFSFHELNHGPLVAPFVVKFIAQVIRFLGTRNMLLRTQRNTLDFMKDVVTFLSNVSQSIILPGKEEALCLLHFLLSFAPTPPTITPDKDVLFTFYDPNLHKYTPPAVDSLAKLLARDEPNRTYYKTIFAADSGSNPAYELLTRTFALAISPLPDPHRRAITRSIISLINPRRPFLLQGLLAAEILANIAPGPDSGLTRSWLASSDGFALCLLRLVNLLATDPSSWAAPPQHRGRPTEDPNMYNFIVYRGLAVLHRLAEKSKNTDGPNDSFPTGIFPTKVNLMGALGFKDIDTQFLRHLCAYAALED
jgi:SWI/SNF chromatin-remodeling complex subunit SWI1